MREKIINWLIKVTKTDTNKISDGYHTFEDLYDHRITLFIALLMTYQKFHDYQVVWKSKRHSDGSEWKGWFIAGLFSEEGKQITYHLPVDRWSELNILELNKAPKWDGHTPKDVIERLKKL